LTLLYSGMKGVALPVCSDHPGDRPVVIGS
jgi:hypothetical protein